MSTALRLSPGFPQVANTPGSPSDQLQRRDAATREELRALPVGAGAGQVGADAVQHPSTATGTNPGASQRTSADYSSKVQQLSTARLRSPLEARICSMLSA